MIDFILNDVQARIVSGTIFGGVLGLYIVEYFTFLWRNSDLGSADPKPILPSLSLLDYEIQNDLDKLKDLNNKNSDILFKDYARTVIIAEKLINYCFWRDIGKKYILTNKPYSLRVMLIRSFYGMNAMPASPDNSLVSESEFLGKNYIKRIIQRSETKANNHDKFFYKRIIKIWDVTEKMKKTAKCDINEKNLITELRKNARRNGGVAAKWTIYTNPLNGLKQIGYYITIDDYKSDLSDWLAYEDDNYRIYFLNQDTSFYLLTYIKEVSVHKKLYMDFKKNAEHTYNPILFDPLTLNKQCSLVDQDEYITWTSTHWAWCTLYPITNSFLKLSEKERIGVTLWTEMNTGIKKMVTERSILSINKNRVNFFQKFFNSFYIKIISSWPSRMLGILIQDNFSRIPYNLYKDEDWWDHIRVIEQIFNCEKFNFLLRDKKKKDSLVSLASICEANAYDFDGWK